MRRFADLSRALLRAGFAESLAYRAEFLVWILTTNLPLVNLALWSAVAHEAPVEGWQGADFAVYYLATLVVRHLTGAWVVWALTSDIRRGDLAQKLLKPVHPLWVLAAENISALPVRAVVAVPFALLLLHAAGPDRLASGVLPWFAAALMIALAWTMTFLVMAIIGTCSFFVESAYSLFEVWSGLFMVFSGYLVPLQLFPEWLREAGRYLPFRLMLSLPVETMLGRIGGAEIAEGLALQAAWVAVLWLALRAFWRAGLRRWAAYGG